MSGAVPLSATGWAGCLPQGSSSRYVRAGWGLRLIMLATIAGLYFLAARFGFLMAFATAQVSAVWPPTGLAAVAYVLYGWRVWPGVFAGAFAINAVSNEPLPTAVGIALGNTAAGLVGLALMARWTRLDAGLQTLPSVLSWALAAAAGCVVSASNGVLQLGLAGIVPWPALPGVWVIWWVGDTMGVLLLGSLLLTCLHPGSPRPRPPQGWVYLLEAPLVWSVLLALCWTAFVREGLQADTAMRLEYAVFPSVIWLGLRFTQRDVALAVMAVCGFAIWGAIHGKGPFASHELDHSLVQLELFMAITAMTGLTLGAATAQRRAAEQAAQDALEALEGRVLARTADLAKANVELAKRHSELADEANERARQQALIEAALREKESLLREVYHRVKNNLQVIQSLLRLQQRGISDPFTLGIITGAEQRVRAMSLVHEMLYQSANVAAVPLRAYVHELFAHIAKSSANGRRHPPQAIDLVLDVGDIHLGLEEAVPLGLLLTELMANSVKHAFPEGRPGHLSVTLRTREQGDALLTVADDGVGLPEGFDLGGSRGGGISIADALARQLGGALQVRASQQGTCIETLLKLPDVPPPPPAPFSKESAHRDAN